MPATFTPTPVVQQTYVEPSDGDLKPVASVKPMLEGLADGLAATLSFAFNWGRSSSNTNNLKRGAWFAADQAWFGVGDGGSDFLEVSLDGARSWVSLTGSLGSSLVCQDVATDGVSIIVLLAETVKTTYVGARTAYGAYTFAAHTNALHNNLSSGLIDFDSAHAKFLAAYRSGGAGVFIESTSDGITWTAATVPAAWSGYTGTAAFPNVGCNALGKSVAYFWDNLASLYRIAYSSDGATWTATAGSIATSLSGGPITNSRPIYEPVYGDWFFVGAKTSTRSTEIFRSSDNGVTWTNLGPGGATDMALQEIATFAGTLIGVNDDGRIYSSVDRGQTWKLTTKNTISSAARPGLRCANGQAVVFNSADKTTFATHRFGAVGT